MVGCEEHLVNMYVFLSFRCLTYLVFWGPEDDFWTSFWQLFGGLGDQIRDFGRSQWQAEILIDSGTSPGGSQIKIIRSGEGKRALPGPHSSILQTGGRSQDTAYRILHATWLKFSKDAGHKGYRMQTRMQDT